MDAIWKYNWSILNFSLFHAGFSTTGAVSYAGGFSMSRETVLIMLKLSAIFILLRMKIQSYHNKNKEKRKIHFIRKAPTNGKSWVRPLRPTWREVSTSVLFSVTVLNVCLQNDVAALLKPISDKIQEIQTFRERNRGSAMFNHLSAVSESIPALGWIAVVSPDAGLPSYLVTLWEYLRDSIVTFRLLCLLSVTLKEDSGQADCISSYPIRSSVLCSKMWKVFDRSLQSKICL